MNRSSKVLFTILIILIFILAGTSGYLYSKYRNLSQKENQKTESSDTKKIDTESQTSSASTKSSTPATEPAALKDRPSSPADTYKVESGDTLYTIASKFDTSWPKLMEANGLTDANKIVQGQSLIIPKNNMVNFTINQEKAQELQTGANSGKYAFRLDSIETSKSDSNPVYGLVTTDKFEQKSIDKNLGSAVIIATHGDKKYEISLTQPITKGDKGIWAIQSIKPSA